MHTIILSAEEERLAQLITRDAWGYFNEQITSRELFHVKELPMMPRSGRLDLTNDAEIIQYFVDSTDNYKSELCLRGFSEDTAEKAAESLRTKLESQTGILKGTVNVVMAAS